MTKLRINGAYYLIGALLLLAGVPLYQLLVLLPQGYADALASAGKGSFSSYVLWIGHHLSQFLGYRALLVISFAVLLSLPFTLFRIIVAQEILGQEEEGMGEETKEIESTETQTPDGMPEYAWRGKGFAVLAAWSGLLSIILYTLGTLASQCAQYHFQYHRWRAARPVVFVLWSNYRQKGTKAVARGMGCLWLYSACCGCAPEWQCGSSSQRTYGGPGSINNSCYPALCSLGSLVRYYACTFKARSSIE